jgi:hypothetical protein
METKRMQYPILALCITATLLSGCSRPTPTANAAPAAPPQSATQAAPSSQPGPGAKVDLPVGFENGVYRGFDRNDYPGDAVMQRLMSEHAAFAFTGYWLTTPPGETTNTWLGKRTLIRQQGWGFLVLANGRLDAEILKAQKHGTTPAALGQKDAATAAAAAQTEGFPPQTILFLDQEEGGRLLPEQAAYLLAWTEAIASTGFRPGVYASGQPVPDDPGKTITTIEDIRSHFQQKNLHPIAFFDAQDTCPPAPGCTLHTKPLTASGEPTLSPGGPLIAWQYSQSPRRPELTQSCAKTYAPDGNCYAPGFPTIFLDMDAATTPDPSHGR